MDVLRIFFFGVFVFSSLFWRLFVVLSPSLFSFDDKKRSRFLRRAAAATGAYSTKTARCSFCCFIVRIGAVARCWPAAWAPSCGNNKLLSVHWFIKGSDCNE